MRKYWTRTRARPLWNSFGAPTGPTRRPDTPASSRVSRSAASASVSPGSMWPLGKIQMAGSRFARTSRIEMAPSLRRNTIPPACGTGEWLPILSPAGRRCAPLALFDQPLELGVVEIDDIEPHLQHVVHAAFPEADPHVVIRVAAIRLGVVVHADQVQHRARRQQRRLVVRVHVVDVPVEVEVIDRAEDRRSVRR